MSIDGGVKYCGLLVDMEYHKPRLHHPAQDVSELMNTLRGYASLLIALEDDLPIRAGSNTTGSKAALLWQAPGQGDPGKESGLFASSSGCTFALQPEDRTKLVLAEYWYRGNRKSDMNERTAQLMDAILNGREVRHLRTHRMNVTAIRWADENGQTPGVTFEDEGLVFTYDELPWVMSEETISRMPERIPADEVERAFENRQAEGTRHAQVLGI